MEEFLARNSKLLIFSLIGLILIGFGVLSYKTSLFSSGDKVEVLSSTTEGKRLDSNTNQDEIVAEISGAVENPGVYRFSSGARIDDLLISAGGISGTADRVWVEKFINRAAKLVDGQKIYIYHSGEATAKDGTGIKIDQGVLGIETSGLVNINAASLSELDKLPGIGPVYAQKITEQRPYSSLEELVTKGVVGQSLYEKIKNDISLY